MLCEAERQQGQRNHQKEKTEVKEKVDLAPVARHSHVQEDHQSRNDHERTDTDDLGSQNVQELEGLDFLEPREPESSPEDSLDDDLVEDEELQDEEGKAD